MINIINQELEKIYNQKKADYEQIFAGIESENAALEEEVKRLRVKIRL